MQTSHPVHAISALFLALTTAHVLAQGGPLTPPPGIPAPTMKTLDHVEPRIPLVAGSPGVTIAASGQITINQSGSYYLTGNVDINSEVSAISILANGVSLDLMGYSIRYLGAGVALDAIAVLANNVTIQNGHIISTTTHDGSSFTLGGFDFGVWASASLHNISVSNLSIQGVRGAAIVADGSSCLVENCRIRIAGATGISSSQGIVRNCTIETCGFTGISAHTVIDCRVNQALGIGINAAIVANSSAVSTLSTAIFAVQTVSGCYGESSSTVSSSHGINASSATVTGSKGATAGGHGIVAGVVTSSYATSAGTSGLSSSGISATSVADSYGFALSGSGGHGISASISVSNSVGLSNATVTGRHGISASAATVTGSRGSSAGGHGILATVVNASRGFSTGTHGSSSSGISCSNASDSFGTTLASDGGHGISASHTVDGSYGESSNTASNLHGISCSSGTVTSSRGVAQGGHGISSSVVNSSRGASSGTNAASSSGIFATTVTDSFGRAEASGGGHGISGTNVTGSNGFAATGARNGINATLATNSYGSRGSTEAGFYGIGATQANGCRLLNNEFITTKYNMP